MIRNDEMMKYTTAPDIPTDINGNGFMLCYVPDPLIQSKTKKNDNIYWETYGNTKG